MSTNDVQNVELTLRKSEAMGDWYVIELAHHDGRAWMEPIEGGMALRTSARLSDADVEGTGAEMLEIAGAIERREAFATRRCAVSVAQLPAGETLCQLAFFESPRNSTRPGVVPLARADALAALIRATLGVPRPAPEAPLASAGDAVRVVCSSPLAWWQREVAARWGTSEYNAAYRADATPHRDLRHALAHVDIARGELARAVDAFQHRGDERAAYEEHRAGVAKRLADLFFSVLRVAETYPLLRIELEEAAQARLEEKFPRAIPAGAARPDAARREQDPE